MLDDALPSRDETFPTPLEAVGAALKAAGKEMASYRPPRLTDRYPSLGGCTPGWLADDIPGGWIIVTFRPAGLLSDEDRYAIQLNELQNYQARVFPAPEYETLWNRRAVGFPALLVRKATG